MPGFEAASTAARKRKAEDSVNDKLMAMATTIGQLMAAQKEIVENQKASLESNRTILDRNKELTEMIRTQGEEIKALQALIQDSARQSSEVTASGSASVSPQTSQTRPTSAGSSPSRNDKPQV